MIISASRRTDIPAFYSEWFFNRLREGYVLTRNPMNYHQISRVSLLPEAVDAIVFWTKNPTPMLPRLGELEKYPYYVQFTLTSYGPEIETGLPSKNQVIISAFQTLSKEIGRERVVWRYDPIFFSDRYTMEYHCKYFKVLASKLSPYTEKCTVSFLDLYRNTERNLKPFGFVPDDLKMQEELLERFAEIAKECGIDIDTCAEPHDFDHLGVGHARCIDQERIERISGTKLKVGRDRNQRAACGCVSSVDIGMYNTCLNGCRYCYANYQESMIQRNFRSHDPKSPLLFGNVTEGDVIKERR
ncbi:MAG: DUF1848 domain-containing protein [Lachnospiraceae bacterium]|nr:DUF1848 domain-containing protein [Lachnospiraceae bacterium]